MALVSLFVDRKTASAKPTVRAWLADVCWYNTVSPIHERGDAVIKSGKG